MADELEEILICAPITAFHVIRGSRTTTCTSCQGAVWVAPSGQAMLRDRPATRPMCVKCAVPLVEAADSEDSRVMALPLTAEQLAEVQAYDRTHRG